MIEWYQVRRNDLTKTRRKNMYTVLVCDDDRAILESIRIYLSAEGYDVLTATDGREAIDLLKDHDVHCLVLDIMMPHMDGLTAMLKIRETSNVPVILLSAKSEDTDKITGLSFGADDYVTKPFNPLELVARVKSQVRRYAKLGSMEISEHVLVTGGLELDTKKSGSRPSSTRSSNTSCGTWDTSCRPRRSTRPSGTNPRCPPRKLSRYISATSAKRSRSIRKIQTI